MDSVGGMTAALYAFVKRHPMLIKPMKSVLALVYQTQAIVYKVFKKSNKPVVPKALCGSTAHWVRDFANRDTGIQASIRYFHHETKHRRLMPNTPDGQVFWKFSENIEYALPATFVAQIADARVLDEGFVISPDDQLLGDVSVIIGQKGSKHRAFYLGGIGPVRRVPGQSAVIATYAGRGYYHWMIDVLPRLELIRLAGHNFEEIDHFIVNCYITSYQIETLKALNIPHEKLVLTQLNRHLSVENLILPSLTNVYHTVPCWACDFIRKSFLVADAGHQLRSSRRRIYISRRIASQRRVINEVALIKLLKKRSFDIVVLEEMTVAEQAKLFNNASVVVGPHGAGLTNLLFCQPLTQVLEIINPRAVSLMFWTIASHRKLKYYYIFSRGPLFAANGDEPFLNSESMEVDLKSMSRMLDYMGIA